MEFPDGAVKEGFFENNVFVGKVYNLEKSDNSPVRDVVSNALRDSSLGLPMEATPVRNSTKQPLPLN